MQVPVFDRVRLLQDWIGPILPFEPVRRLGNPHNVRGHLWIEMRGHGDARRTRNGGSPLPPGDAANAHEIRHDKVARPALKSLVHLARTVEVLADLQRRLQFGREPGIAVEIVVDDRLLDPGQPVVVDHVAALKRLGQG